MPDYKFSATYTEVSEITIWIEADSEKEARNFINNRAFDWEEETKHQDYISSEFSNITLEKTIDFHGEHP